jgi:hypothetical protein
MSTRRTFLKAGIGAAASLAAMPAIGQQSRDLASLTLKQVSDMLRTKAVSPVELTNACLQRIEQYNSAFNAFITACRASRFPADLPMPVCRLACRSAERTLAK